VEAGDLRERLAQRSLRLALDVDVDRAGLEGDAAGLEQREPGAAEDVALAAVAPAVCQLQQEVRVGVGDQGGRSSHVAGAAPCLDGARHARYRLIGLRAGRERA
jgi:hypothetical protein